MKDIQCYITSQAVRQTKNHQVSECSRYFSRCWQYSSGKLPGSKAERAFSLLDTKKEIQFIYGESSMARPPAVNLKPPNNLISVVHSKVLIMCRGGSHPAFSVIAHLCSLNYSLSTCPQTAVVTQNRLNLDSGPDNPCFMKLFSITMAPNILGYNSLSLSFCLFWRKHFPEVK